MLVTRRAHRSSNVTIKQVASEIAGEAKKNKNGVCKKIVWATKLVLAGWSRGKEVRLNLFDLLSTWGSVFACVWAAFVWNAWIDKGDLQIFIERGWSSFDWVISICTLVTEFKRGVPLLIWFWLEQLWSGKLFEHPTLEGLIFHQYICSCLSCPKLLSDPFDCPACSLVIAVNNTKRNQIWHEQ